MAVGDPSNPLPKEDLIAKFMNQVDFSRKVSRGNAEKIIEMVDKLEKIDNIREIIELAVKK
jgi:hypothetical protein